MPAWPMSPELVESIVPTLRIGQLDERTVVASALVAALFGCTCCIMRASVATELVASSSGLMQPGDEVPGHAWCPDRRSFELARGLHAAQQVACVHANCRMMQLMQLRSLSATTHACGGPGRACTGTAGGPPGPQRSRCGTRCSCPCIRSGLDASPPTTPVPRGRLSGRRNGRTRRILRLAADHRC